jgi:hypothetical protein
MTEMYRGDAFMKGWHEMCIRDRERAAEVARVRAELKAKLETALLIAKLQRMGKA